MPEQYPSVGAEEGSGEYLGETSRRDEAAVAAFASEDADDLMRELESLEARLALVTDLVRELRADNAELREQNLELVRERDALWRERGVVSARLAQIIAKVDALRGET
jgi:hypothetical protein